MAAAFLVLSILRFSVTYVVLYDILKGKKIHTDNFIIRRLKFIHVYHTDLFFLLLRPVHISPFRSIWINLGPSIIISKSTLVCTGYLSTKSHTGYLSTQQTSKLKTKYLFPFPVWIYPIECKQLRLGLAYTGKLEQKVISRSWYSNTLRIKIFVSGDLKDFHLLLKTRREEESLVPWAFYHQSCNVIIQSVHSYYTIFLLKKLSIRWRHLHKLDI